MSDLALTLGQFYSGSAIAIDLVQFGSGVTIRSRLATAVTLFVDAGEWVALGSTTRGVLRLGPNGERSDLAVAALATELIANELLIGLEAASRSSAQSEALWREMAWVRMVFARLESAQTDAANAERVRGAAARLSDRIDLLEEQLRETP